MAVSDPGVYVHVPFCVKKCAYCHFAIDPGRPDDARRARYLDALRREIRGGRGGRVDTLYFGGGTPSLLPAGEIAALVAELKSVYEVAGDAEVTLEANPRDLDDRGFAAMRAAGVNRLSLGVQSFDDGVLRDMFRDHDASDSDRSVVAARRAGLRNVSLDLILGWPGETRERFTHTVDRLLGLEPEHVSVYVLETDGKTVMAHRERRGTLRRRPRVYGCAGSLKICRIVPCSTILPAYITATSSQTSATTPRSCVMSRSARFSSR